MPWVVGIDEAGYGPNLGPLVQAAATVWCPPEDISGWQAYAHCVRRCHEPADGRLLIDDSKLVHSGANKLAKLERTVLHFLDVLAPEPNFRVRPLVTEPDAFNRIILETGNKADTLSRGVIEMLQTNVDGTEPLVYFCDKQGGRNFYGPMLQQAFPEYWISAECEGSQESRYRVHHPEREVTVIFRPKADASSLAVALASMTAKYLREVSMRQFNAFWAKHVPGLKPTAGYPQDAKRFYAEIEPAMAALGITKDHVWRSR